MEFALGATDGPRHGRMREYFALVTGSGASEAGGDATGIGAGPGSGRGVAVALPELRGECVRDPSRWDDAVQRLWALAGRRRFAEAEEQLLALSGEATRDPDADRRWAEVLGRLAEVHADDPGPGVYDWMRDRALRHWYAWGATATSGGEGAARLLEMEPARRRLEALDQRRTRGKGTWRS